MSITPDLRGDIIADLKSASHIMGFDLAGNDFAYVANRLMIGPLKFRLERLAHLELRDKLANELTQFLEWSDTYRGQPTGSGLDNGPIENHCPTCDALENTTHLAGCKIALFLGRPNTLPRHDTGSLAL